jgi:hypothetical protein
MNDDPTDARPVPVPPAVHDLIRQVAPERGSPPDNERRLEIKGREWLVRVVGELAGGTGARGVAYLTVVQFHPAPNGEREGRGAAPREALLPRGKFEFLYDEELIQLFHAARPIPRQSRG